MKNRIIKGIIGFIFILAIHGCAQNNQVNPSGIDASRQQESSNKEEQTKENSVEILDDEISQKSLEIDVEEVVSVFRQMDETMNELTNRMDKEGYCVSKEELYDSISIYYDEHLTEYVCFLYRIVEKEGQFFHDRHYGRQNFMPDISEEITLLSVAENACEIGVVFKHRWERKWAREVVPVLLEKREDKWIITGISQWYNDFRYTYMRNEIFTPQNFSQKEAEELVKRFATEDEVEGLFEIDTDEDEWVLADSSNSFLKNEDIKELSRFEMYMAIQEIYARHGKKFNDAMLEQHFNRQNWYTPYKMIFSTAVLSEIEKENIEILTQASGLEEEATRQYGCLYPRSEQEESRLGEEEASVIIVDAFKNAIKIVEVKEENYLEDKSEGEQNFYSLGEYSEPEKLREYLSKWFSEESIDYLLACFGVSKGLELDEGGKYCISTEYTYAGVWQEIDTFTAVEIIESNENNCTVNISFINTQVAWTEDVQINKGEIVLVKEHDNWLVGEISLPYYEELMNNYNIE